MYKSLRAQTLHYFARPHEYVPREPLNTPAAWLGKDVRQQGDWHYQLCNTEIGELQAAVTQAESSDKPMEQLTRTDFPLPTLAPRIDDWRREIRHGRGFILIRGFPVHEWTEQQSAIAYWCLGHHFGIPGAQNPEGDLLGHVRDQRTGQDVRYYRTNKAIAPHCDAADFVGLLCLNKAKSGGLSRIASSVAVYNEVLARKPELVERLFKPIWFDTKGDGGIRAFPIAPCAYANGELRTFWQSDYYREAQKLGFVPEFSDADWELIDCYDSVASDPDFYLDMDLEPGDIQLISNHTILHARTGYEDWDELAQRRHLLRLWISLPERKSLKQRWLTAKSLAGLVGTSSRELLLNRLNLRSADSP